MSNLVGQRRVFLPRQDYDQNKTNTRLNKVRNKKSINVLILSNNQGKVVHLTLIIPKRNGTNIKTLYFLSHIETEHNITIMTLTMKREETLREQEEDLFDLGKKNVNFKFNAHNTYEENLMDSPFFNQKVLELSLSCPQQFYRHIFIPFINSSSSNSGLGGQDKEKSDSVSQTYLQWISILAAIAMIEQIDQTSIPDFKGDKTAMSQNPQTARSSSQTSSQSIEDDLANLRERKIVTQVHRHKMPERRLLRRQSSRRIRLLCTDKKKRRGSLMQSKTKSLRKLSQYSKSTKEEKKETLDDEEIARGVGKMSMKLSSSMVVSATKITQGLIDAADYDDSQVHQDEDEEEKTIISHISSNSSKSPPHDHHDGHSSNNSEYVTSLEDKVSHQKEKIHKLRHKLSKTTRKTSDHVFVLEMQIRKLEQTIVSYKTELTELQVEQDNTNMKKIECDTNRLETESLKMEKEEALKQLTNAILLNVSLTNDKMKLEKEKAKLLSELEKNFMLLDALRREKRKRIVQGLKAFVNKTQPINYLH